jgi:DNA-directed RNA polymerase subunit B'
LNRGCRSNRRRRGGKISNEINVSYYPELKEIRVNTDAGRVRRPLIVIENSRSKLTEEKLQ